MDTIDRMRRRGASRGLPEWGAMVALAGGLFACQDQRAEGTGLTPARPAATTAPGERAQPAGSARASATIQPASGSDVKGVATFVEEPEGVRVVVDITGAEPGEHGLHVHEKGDCSHPKAESAGDHFSPDPMPHGMPMDTQRHLGDLGNITVGQDRKGHAEILARGATLGAGKRNSFEGRAVIVHEKKDVGAQPSGGAGGRIGCGVIEPSKQ